MIGGESFTAAFDSVQVYRLKQGQPKKGTAMF